MATNVFSPSDFATLKSRIHDAASMLVNGLNKDGDSLGWKRIVIVTSKEYQNICSVLASHLNCHVFITIPVLEPLIVVRDLNQAHSSYSVDVTGIPQEA